MTKQTHDPGADAAPAPAPAPEKQAEQQQAPQQDSNAPADVLRDGNIKATIWKNERENGPSFSTVFARTWQDEEGAYRDSHSFSGTELLRVSELARGAYTRTIELRQEHRHEYRVEISRDDSQGALKLDEDSRPQESIESFKSKRSVSVQDQQGRSQTVARRK